MRLADAGVVVTGGGAGIGAAMARRFAAAGARVVVNDVDGSAAQAVATEVGGLAAPGDAADPDVVTELVHTSRARLGEVDLFCANAGVAPSGGPEADDEAWTRAWEVNVLGHVRAARALLPGWLRRGRGHFLATVSAAGLLTMLGSAPYAVSKHAALAFAEWLAVTYADRGVTVQAVCPQGVRTAMLEQAGPTGRQVLAPTALAPDAVADAVVAALDGGPFLVLPHPEVAGWYAARARDTDRWLAGMRRLQRRVDARTEPAP